MMGSNHVVIAAAGSGKTTYLVNEALKVKDDKVLITTYTESNEAEIRQKIFDVNGHLPANVVVMTWFAFLISHGVKPFQGSLFDFPVKGMQLVSSRSGLKARDRAGRPLYWGEADFERHYFDSRRRIYSDKLAKLVIRCNEASKGNVFDRVSRAFRHIFVDEVQDLAGHDLDILTAFFASASRIVLVGDPRQVTYLTHNEAKYDKYAEGKLVQFLKEKLPKRVAYELDEESLNTSHRNSDAICALASRLYPELKASTACKCASCRKDDNGHAGFFIVRPDDIARYIATFRPMQLCLAANSKGVDRTNPAMNFGASKGRGFDRVLIHPTDHMLRWLRNDKQALANQTRAKLYVALTRARMSVAVVANLNQEDAPVGFELFAPAF